jgi:hypothetical protein
VLLFCRELPAGTLRLDSPIDYQVYQRPDRGECKILIAGVWPAGITRPTKVEARLIGPGAPAAWRILEAVQSDSDRFRADLNAPPGGWYRLEVRVRDEGSVIAETAVEHVGVGEVFVVAGQSNSANHGEERQRTKTGLVAAFHEGKWQLANDPQPGASGDGGSFIPAFGDAIAERFDVPVGIIACGVGATSVREWLPRGTHFPNPPTLTGNVTQLANGEWESKGILFERLVKRIKQISPRGFRAVLWHQGESDANQKDASRTLEREMYRKSLEQLIHDSRREAGWEFPWFVAQASYHTPEDTGSSEIRAAQEVLWKSGVAIQGPNTDTMTGDLRDSGGKGVHFSGKGLREHGLRWAERVSPWLEKQLGF